jgi:hypothetical protein
MHCETVSNRRGKHVMLFAWQERGEEKIPLHILLCGEVILYFFAYRNHLEFKFKFEFK